jgi:hypothetical protein
MNSEHRPIIYLSPPTQVSMGDWWFDIATVDHFWIRRRFDVMRRIAASFYGIPGLLPKSAAAMACCKEKWRTREGRKVTYKWIGD